MREIKFRAWSLGNEHGMRVFNLGDIDGGGLLFPDSTWIDIEDCIIEQFTGLRDKNGREIYEGDIVRFDVVASERGPERRGRTGVVQDVPRYGWGIGGYSPAWIKNEEVIGNIHENPELLNEAI